MRLRKWLEWLVSESVSLELDNKCYDSNIPKFFLRLVNHFEECLNENEKKMMSRFKNNIKENINELYDKIINKDVREAIKQVRASDI